MANVLVFGHQNPDNDAIMSAVVLSQLLNQVEYAGNTYEACALGQLPAESAKLLADAGIAEPRVIESVEAGQLVVLTDHNESAQSVAGLKDATVFGVVDHHRIGDFETAGPLHYICLPWGSSCTIVTKLAGVLGVELSDVQAKLLLSAMMTDTLMLKSPTTTDVDRAVAIDEIKKFVAEQELQADKRYIPKVITHRGIADPYPEKIAIIGAGPAGLSCAYYLANMGYENVTVFDKNEVPGGMLTLGIPSFRLEKDVVNAEIEVLREMGVHFQCGVEIGKDLTIDQLREQGYKGFYLAIGAQKSAPIGVPGEELSGVYGGVDFLRRVNLGKKPRIGKKCAVIGGGNVAMDVCRTAIRLGAKDTYIIYRRSQAEMPADAEEVAEAMEEGVQFRFLSAPAEILGENGKVKALKVELMELGEPDAKGRRKPVGTGKFETIEVTSVIGAIGQRVDLGHIAPEAMAFNRNGTVQADGVTYQTAQPDIFAGGDVVTGPKFAIDAIAAGREGAISLHRYVHEGQSLTLARDPREFYELDKKQAVVPIDCFDAPARQTVAHDASKAKTFSNDRITFTEAQVKAEASRCLGCGVSVVDQNKCIGCGLCTTRCEFDAIHLQRDMPEASRMYRTEDKMKAILPHMVKRAAKLTIKDIKGKRAK